MKTLIEYDGTFSSSALDLLLKDYHLVRKRYDNVIKTKIINETEANSVISDMTEFIKGVRAVCTAKWAKFNDMYIYIGIVILILQLISVCSMLILQRNNQNPKASFSQLLTNLKGILLTDYTSGISLLLVTFHSFSLFSNSFVIFEQTVVTVSTQTLIILLAFNALRQQWSNNNNNNTLFTKQHAIRILWPYFGIMVCTRLSSIFHSCRDQQDECIVIEFLQPFNKYNNLSLVNNIMKTLLLCLSVFFYRLVITHSERTFDKYLSCNKKYADIFFNLTFVFLREYIGGILVILFLDNLFKIVSVALAWMIYTTFVIGLAVLIWKPWLLAGKYIKEIDWRLIGANDIVIHCLSPVTWLLMMVLLPIVMIVVVPNDTYIVVFVLMILQLSLTVVILQETPRGTYRERGVAKRDERREKGEWKER